jgi:hypothetical protein
MSKRQKSIHKFQIQYPKIRLNFFKVVMLFFNLYKKKDVQRSAANYRRDGCEHLTSSNSPMRQLLANSFFFVQGMVLGVPSLPSSNHEEQ